MFDVIVIGQGPAGISAAIYAVRSGAKTLVIGHGRSALLKAAKVDNYYGAGSVSGRELHDRAVRQFAELGGESLEAEVTSIEPKGPGAGFLVETERESYEGRTVVLAAGKTRAGAKLDGLERLEGRGVSHCAICDGFFFRGKRLGVLGGGNYAAAEAAHLLNIASELTIFTNGRELTASGELPCKADTRKIRELRGEQKLTGLAMEDGEEFELDGLFVAVGTASALSFAQKLGLKTADGNIVVDKNGMTSLEGIFAAGDCIGGLNQISTAVGEGAIAGQNAAALARLARD